MSATSAPLLRRPLAKLCRIWYVVNGRRPAFSAALASALFRAFRLPRTERSDRDVLSRGCESLFHQRDCRGFAAFPPGDDHVRDLVVELEAVRFQPSHLRGPHPGPVHQAESCGHLVARLQASQHLGDVAPVQPTGLRRRLPERHQVAQVRCGATPVQDAHQVHQGVPPVVAARAGVRIPVKPTTRSDANRSPVGAKRRGTES